MKPLLGRESIPVCGVNKDCIKHSVLGHVVKNGTDRNRDISFDTVQD